ncbi:MAG TPA: FIST N-terminal domain-containing protein, partial [Burkholderiaceae bacterium]|nr:FIST N-terminal domain-containing protein [Burkholderiaceae bacterium]
MNRFLHGHATHPDAHAALALAAAQIEAQRRETGHARAPTLGWVYLTDAYAVQADALLAEMRQRWPGVEWVGATGVGIAASGVEYFDEPALSLLLTDLAPEHFRVFSGARPLTDFDAHTANVHADPATPDLAELLHEMGARTTTGYLFGGLASAPSRALHIAGNALAGGLSGVAFDRFVPLVSRITQGCQPVGPTREVTAATRNLITEL